MGKSVEGQAGFLLARIPDAAILLLFCALFLTQTLLSLRQKSGTFDEAIHLSAGYLSLKFGAYPYKGHPPFVRMLAGVPLLFLDVKMPPQEGPLTRDNRYQYAVRFLYEANDADHLLFWGRAAVLSLGLLLGWFVFLWTKRLFGREAGVFALVLYSFEPNILAHAGLVTADLGIACFMFITIYASYRLTQRVSITRAVCAGFALGLSFASKFSAVALIPVLLLLGTSAIVSRQPVELHLPGRLQVYAASRARKLLVAVGVTLVMALIAYGTISATYRFLHEEPGASGQRYEVTKGQPVAGHPWTEQAIRWAEAISPLPKPYLDGLGASLTSLQRMAFLMGAHSAEGWWYFFVITFLLKTPLSLLLLLVATPVSLNRLWQENPLAVLFLLTPVLLYFGIASASRINIGHRHILPIYPFLIVVASSLLPWVLRQRKAVKGALAVLTIWFVLSSVSIFPHYLAYFNELAGGPNNGYKYLVDSNLDWGQDLKGLKRYMAEHGIQRVWLSYFGSASPDYYRIAYNYLPSFQIVHPPTERIPTPYVAISATNLQGVYLPQLGFGTEYFEDFKHRQPLAKIGYSIFLYRID